MQTSGSKRGGQATTDFMLPVDTTEKASSQHVPQRPPTNMEKGSRAPSKMQEPQPHGMLSN